MAKKKKNKNSGEDKSVNQSSGGGRLLVIFGAISASVFLSTTIILIIGMLPTAVAAAVDNTRRKSRAITVGAMNLAGCSPFLMDLWLDDHSFDAAFAVILDPLAISIMYAAAMVGYVIDWSMSGIVAGMLYQRGLVRQKDIKKYQKKMVERWGPEVTGDISLDEYGFSLEVVEDKSVSE